MNELTNGLSIYVEDTQKTFHTIDDWDFALSNNNYIGDPQMETSYIQVPGREGLIDASEAISGRRIFTKRPLAFNLGGMRERRSWDGIISRLRNDIDGHVCRITLDNDRGYYWHGRVYITDFDRFRGLGSFTLSMPVADPYKISVQSSAEPWLWDPFNFETGVIIQTGAEVISGSGSITIDHGYMLTCPQIVVSDMISSTFKVTYDGTEYALTSGSNTIPAIMVGGDDDVTLTFSGSATVQIVYRSGSL